MNVLLLELNEVNFEFLEKFCARGLLPEFARLLRVHGYEQTTSEVNDHEIEPWIQWVTAHTGKAFVDHGVFRLGDIAKLADVEQIWERVLRECGVGVGAISPMNASNRIADRGFFVPDPWTDTPATGSFLLRKMSAAIGQAVNSNAAGRIPRSAIPWLLVGAAIYSRAENYGEFTRLAVKSIKRPWMRAIFLDLLLVDTFIHQVKRHRPGFASLFVNAAAHIQHHYMYSSSAYEGPHRNPEWYLRAGEDPLLDVYSLYDRVLGQIRRCLPGYRLMIATGLHQDPQESPVYYWRLRDHSSFLRRLAVPFAEVKVRMSRDFLIVCENAEDAAKVTRLLNGVRDGNGVPAFQVDNRGVDVFVMLTYPHDIGSDTEFSYELGPISNFADEVLFVALKNGRHNGVGYFLDTGRSNPDGQQTFPLTQLPDRILEAVAA